MALMKHGVPEGSILRPLLFIVFINDLPLHVSSSIDLYTDDMTITASMEYNLWSTIFTSVFKQIS